MSRDPAEIVEYPWFSQVTQPTFVFYICTIRILTQRIALGFEASVCMWLQDCAVPEKIYTLPGITLDKSIGHF